MAGDWLKIRHNLDDDPHVLRIRSILGGPDIDLVIGKLRRLWKYADQHTTNGLILFGTAAVIDEIVNLSGFAVALAAVGWLEFTEMGAQIPRFHEHNGESAKERSLNALRVARHRRKRKQSGPCNGCNGTAPLPEKRREEKNREEEKTTPPPPSGEARRCLENLDGLKTVPTPGMAQPNSGSAGQCDPRTVQAGERDSTGLPKETVVNPMRGRRGDVSQSERDSPLLAKDFLEAWNASGLSRARELTGKRLRALRARCRKPQWRAHWREALERAASSSFCRGQGERGWVATVDWFLREETVTKLLEGQFDDRQRCLGGKAFGHGQPSADGGFRPNSRVPTSTDKLRALENKTLRVVPSEDVG